MFRVHSLFLGLNCNVICSRLKYRAGRFSLVRDLNKIMNFLLHFDLKLNR